MPEIGERGTEKCFFAFFLSGEPGEFRWYSDYSAGWTIRVSKPGRGKSDLSLS